MIEVTVVNRSIPSISSLLQGLESKKMIDLDVLWKEEQLIWIAVMKRNWPHSQTIHRIYI